MARIIFSGAMDGNNWEPEFLDHFPMDPNTMVQWLEPALQDQLWAYVAETAHSDALADILRSVSREYPDYLRVKELFETMEVYRRIGQEVYEKWRVGRVRSIYDLACGHGLLGILLAWRFRQAEVVCVDLERRPAYGYYLEQARKAGSELGNVRFLESDIGAVDIPSSAFVICIHACNEATQVALDLASSSGACYAAMPCCIRDGIYLRRIKHTDDRARYAAAVGVIAGQYGAEKITAIDERITNRNLILVGDAQNCWPGLRTGASS